MALKFECYNDDMLLIEANKRNIRRGKIAGPIANSWYAVVDGWEVGMPIGAGATEIEAVKSLVRIMEL